MVPEQALTISRIRVARIITRLNVGGPARQAITLTERLDPARYETLLITGLTGPAEGDLLALRGQELRRTVVPTLVRDVSPLSDLRALGAIARTLRRFRPHVVHTHMAKAGMLGRVAARMTGVPVVLHTFHGNVLQGYFAPPVQALFTALERALARISTRVIAISPRQARELTELGIASRPRLVELPLGLELGPFLASQGRLRQELGTPDDELLVGIVARLVPIKGVDVFLRVAERVSVARGNVRFVVVGDGELGAELRDLARELGIDGRVHFLGWRTDLPAIYPDLDVVVLTSHNEGTPVSLIEAHAAGRPVVATAVGGVPDVVEHGGSGLLCRDGDVDALASAISLLLDDPQLRRRYGLRGRESVYPAYDAATLVRRIDELYSSLVPAVRTMR